MKVEVVALATQSRQIQEILSQHGIESQLPGGGVVFEMTEEQQSTLLEYFKTLTRIQKIELHEVIDNVRHPYVPTPRSSYHNLFTCGIGGEKD